LEKTDVSEVRTASIALMMQAVRISKTSVYSNETTEGSNFHIRRRENLKSHMEKKV
jgi:hypothetical protein